MPDLETGRQEAGQQEESPQRNVRERTRDWCRAIHAVTIGPNSFLARRGGWLIGLCFLALVIAVFYTQFASPGDFWMELNQGGEPISPRLFSMISYCKEADLMLMVGGVVSGTEEPTNEVAVYDFSAGQWSKITPPEEFPGRAAGNVEPIRLQGSSDSCGFVVFGGVTGAERTDMEESVWFLGLSSNTQATFKEVTNFTGDGPLRARYHAGAVGYEDKFFVLGGQAFQGDGETVVSFKNLHRLSLRFNPEDPEEILGEWASFEFANSKPRHSFASTIVADEWIIHGGRESGAKMVDRNLNMERYNLKELSQASPGNGSYQEAYKVLDQTLILQKYFHTMASNGQTVFLYGGARVTFSGLNSRDMYNNYVAITAVDLANNGLRCSASGSRSYEWCGSTAQYPGFANYAKSIVRGNMMIVYRYFDGESSILSLNMVVMERSAYKANASDLESSPFSLGVSSLQYSLVAACLFLLILIALLYRSRSVEEDMIFRANGVPIKRIGVTQKVIDKLPLVKYKPNGKHIRVKVEDKDGERIVTELGPTQPPRRPSTVPHSDWEGGEEKAEDEKDEADEEDQGDDDEDLDLVCSICICEFEEDEILMELPCKHLFHDDCVTDWLLRKGICPMCRRHVVHGKVDTRPEDIITAAASPSAVAPQEGESGELQLAVQGGQLDERRSRRISRLNLSSRTSRRIAELQLEIEQDEAEERARLEEKEEEDEQNAQERLNQSARRSERQSPLASLVSLVRRPSRASRAESAPETGVSLVERPSTNTSRRSSLRPGASRPEELL